MSSRNSVKEYVEDSFYHIYNRGVEKRNIFLDSQDYAVFLSYLKSYLEPKDKEKLLSIINDQKSTWEEKRKAEKMIQLNNFNKEIELCCYCLMPNHFHLLIHQKSSQSIDLFMNSLITRYVMFFNRKYQRVGPLFQDVYKAVRIKTDEQLLYLSVYIHRNPLDEISEDIQGVPLYELGRLSAQPSSLSEYIGTRRSRWISTQQILSYFSKKHKNYEYQSYLRETKVPIKRFSNVTLDL